MICLIVVANCYVLVGVVTAYAQNHDFSSPLANVNCCTLPLHYLYIIFKSIAHLIARCVSFSAGDAVSKDLVKNMTDEQVKEVVENKDFTPTPKTVDYTNRTHDTTQRYSYNVIFSACANHFVHRIDKKKVFKCMIDPDSAGYKNYIFQYPVQ